MNNAVGFDNLEERLAAGGEEQRDLAHETFFEKLLSNYFVEKREQY